MKKMTFLTNPPRRSRRAGARSSARNRVAAAPRRKRRPPPAGWSSWSAYMASIRPSSKRAAASSGVTMAKAGKRRTGRHRRSSGSARRSVVRYRHNPPRIRGGIGGAIKRAPTFAKDVGVGVGGVLAGKIAARKGRGMLGQKPGTVLGSVIEAGIGLVAGMVVSTVSPRMGEYVAIGGVLAPAETLVQQLGIPHVSDSLGDDGFLFGGDSGVEMVSAAPDDSGQLSEFVTGQNGREPAPTLAEYVAGAAA